MTPVPGRFRYFAWMSNPMNGLVSNSQLLEAKELVTQYREGKEPAGTTEEQVGIGTETETEIEISNP